MGRWALLLPFGLVACPAPPEVQLPFTGCARVRPGPICELEAGEPLRVGIADFERVEPSENTRWEDGQLRLAGAAHWRIQGRSARFEIRSVEATSTTSRSQAHFAQARKRLSEGAIEAALGSAALAAGSTEDLQLQVRAHLFAAYVHGVLKHDLEAAEGALSKARAVPLAETMDGGAAILIGHAQLDLRAHRYLEALAKLERAEREAHALGLESLRRTARSNRADVLLELGRFETAAAVHETLASSGSACARAQAGLNAGWARYLDAVRGFGPLDLAKKAMVSTATLYEQHCPNRLGAAANQLNLALLFAAEDDAGQARQALEASKRLLPERPSWLGTWDLDLQGRLLLRRGELGAARTRFETLLSTGEPEAQLRARLGLAEIFRAEHHPEEALEALLEAFRQLESLARKLPATGARASFLGRHELELQRLAELGVAAGQAELVARTSRTVRALVIRALAWPWLLDGLEAGEKSRFQAALSELRTQRERTPRAPAWDTPDDRRAEQTQALEAARKETERAARIAFEALGSAEAPLTVPDVPTLHGFRGQQLWLLEHDGQSFGSDSLETVLAHLPEGRPLRVLGPRLERSVYAALVRTRPTARAVGVRRPSPRTSIARRALVVMDPNRNLPSALAEGHFVAERLEKAGWRVLRLAGAAASFDAVLERLPEVELFHFAGHGHHVPDDPLRSGLDLADGRTLSAIDVLALPGGPRRVVLSGCQTGRPRRLGPTELGLATAFVIQGAAWVVGAVDDVPDRSARAFAQRLYSRGVPRSVEHVRRAQLELRADGDAAWTDFRIFVP